MPLGHGILWPEDAKRQIGRRAVLINGRFRNLAAAEIWHGVPCESARVAGCPSLREPTIRRSRSPSIRGSGADLVVW